MPELEQIKIGDLGSVVTGKTPPTKSPGFWNGEYPFITPKDISSDSYHISTERYLSEKWKEKSPKYLLPNDSSCFVCIGATIGKVCLVDRPSFCNQQINAVIADESKHNRKYVFYLLKTLEEEVKARAGGAATPIVNKSSFSDIEITVISKPEQDKVAEILSAYDSLIENNNRRIVILEEMAQSLYREWFVKLRFPGHESIKFSDSPIGKIPEGWQVVKIKDIGEVITGKTPSKKRKDYYSSKDVPFLKTPDMHGSIFVTSIEDRLSQEGADSQKNKYIPSGSVCVACIGAKAGVAALVPTTVQTNQQINSVIFFDANIREYFYLFASGLTELIRALGSSGATMTNVSKGKFESIELIKPDDITLKSFHATINPCFDMILNLQRKNMGLITMRDLLLQKLISGSLSLNY